MSRNVLIIGGSSGIGRAAVERFAQEGDRVWFTYRSGQHRALATEVELSARGWQVEAFELDQATDRAMNACSDVGAVDVPDDDVGAADEDMGAA